MMTTEQQDILSIALNYLKVIEADVPMEELFVYYSEAVVQIEYPNRLMPQGAKRNLSDLIFS